ncbi:unnamed protein product [Ambrosiozyma monospora]|uniref:Unnamed protein product n=1 Tax=Ambrosiozyma monospora TaxID=43982 RepID=A0ACB5T6K0_AMBMO|nr:unnamed protein product [Ambrosiozyma monospora]
MPTRVRRRSRLSLKRQTSRALSILSLEDSRPSYPDPNPTPFFVDSDDNENSSNDENQSDDEQPDELDPLLDQEQIYRSISNASSIDSYLVHGTNDNTTSNSKANRDFPVDTEAQLNVPNRKSSLHSLSRSSTIKRQQAKNNDRIEISQFKVTVIALCLFSNVFLASIDSTMVATLMTVIASDMNSMSNISWVATSYLLSCAAFQPLFGKLSDVFGRKSILTLCSLLFGLGCLMIGLSRDMWTLVAGRFLTGIGGGGFGAMSTITLSDLVPMKQRGVYQAYNSLFYQCGAASGGLVAGFFQHYFSWRIAFLVQVPFTFFNWFLIQIFFQLPTDAPGSGKTGGPVWKKIKALDWTGTFLLVISMFVLLLAASLGGKEIAFASWTFKLLVIGSLVGLVFFYYYDLKIAEDPILPMSLLHNKGVLYSSVASFFLTMNATSVFFYLPFYWTTVKNMSPFEAGLRLIPSTFTTAI